MKAILSGIWSNLRSMGMVFTHSWRKRDTLMYPEVPIYVPPNRGSTPARIGGGVRGGSLKL